MTAFARIRFAALLLMLFGLTTAPVLAQKLGPDGAPNPTASVANQKTLLEQAPRIQGRIDIPDVKASVLMQPAGRTWDYFHEVLLHWGGAVVIVGMLAVLALAYLIMGRLCIEAGRSGQTIVRFKAFERFAHWLTAVSFVLLGLTGLNITFGKVLLLPLVGPDLFSDISQVAKYVHNFTSFAFVAGLVLITVLFFRDICSSESILTGSSRAAASSSRSMRLQAASISVRNWSIGCRSQPASWSPHRDSCCCFPSTAPTLPTCRSPRSPTPSSRSFSSR